MSFKDIFNEKINDDFVISSFQDLDDSDEAYNLVERGSKDFNDASGILREKGIKIRLETKTSFGTQIDLAKDYPKSEIESVLAGFDVKMNGRSLFVSNLVK